MLRAPSLSYINSTHIRKSPVLFSNSGGASKGPSEQLQPGLHLRARDHLWWMERRNGWWSATQLFPDGRQLRRRRASVCIHIQVWFSDILIDDLVDIINLPIAFRCLVALGLRFQLEVHVPEDSAAAARCRPRKCLSLTRYAALE